MPPRKPSNVRRLRNYSVAVLLVGIAGGLQVLLRPKFEPSSPHFIFMVAVVISAWTGGLGPGLLSTVLSAVVADYFFVKPYYALTIFDRLDISVLLFVLSGVLISWLSEQRLGALLDREQLLAVEQGARAEAEAAARAKDEFLAIISHELRSPLNAILGWTAILQRERTDDVVLEARDVIERNVKVLTRLVQDLLDSARIAYGKLRLEIREVDISAVVASAVDVVRLAAEAKSIDLDVSLDPDAGQIRGDPDRLQQVVWNLLSNAIKFTPRRGRVTVRMEREDTHVSITVTDTGQGISKEFLPLVFARFRQSPNMAVNRSEGLGLGLALVRDLVELHGGSVKAYSDGLGRGATFRVELPCLEIIPARQKAVAAE